MDELVPLNFPEFSFRVRTEGQSKQIFDSVRKRFVTLTPEEWVRQNLVRFLDQVMGYPVALMAIEKEISGPGKSQRADLVVYDRSGKPWMIAECKASHVEVGEDTLLQAARYNRFLEVPYFMLTNGKEHYCLQNTAQGLVFLEGLPGFEGPSEG
jgi:type I site-specific restriction endonuclease